MLAATLAIGCGRIGFGAQPADGAGTIDAPADAATQPAGPKIWLQMETDPTTGIVDSAGAHTCFCDSMTGCPSRAAGLHGFGYKFTGQAVEVADALDLDPSAGFTAAAWVQLEAAPMNSLSTVFAKPISAATDTFVLAVDPGSASTFDSETQTGTTDSFAGPVLPFGEWHHLAFVWTGTEKLGYTDGVLVAAHTVSVGVAATGFFVGGDDSPATFFLTGVVDDVIYYTRALSAAEVAQLATP